MDPFDHELFGGHRRCLEEREGENGDQFWSSYGEEGNTEGGNNSETDLPDS